MSPPVLNSAIALQSALQWPGLRTEYAWLPPHEGASHTKPRQVGVSFSAHQGIVCEHTGRVHERDIRNGAVWITGEDGITWSRVREHTEALEMYPDFNLLGRAAQVAPEKIAIAPALGVSDAVVVGIAARFRRAHVTGEALGDVNASELAWRLLTHLLALYTDHRAAPDQYCGLLDARRLQRVCEFIEANLASPLGIVELASEYGVTPFHFARSFRRTTGITPQQYVTARRMARAKDALLHTPFSVMKVALDAGYQNLSHFRRTFRAHYGGLPRSFRR
jgi:AraC family transcriptional regulator